MLEYMNYIVVILLLGIIFAGMLLLLVLAVGAQKKKQYNNLNAAGEKLEKLLEESEAMLDELNKFSDYVVSMIEEKDNQLAASSRHAEELLVRLKENTVIPVPVREPAHKGKDEQGIPHRDKVVPLNPKHREIIELAEYGMTETDIAKSLQMGKGEVQLILGIKKG